MKSNELPEAKQIRIAKDYEQAKANGKKTTYKDLAKKHNCTFDQVRRYVKAYQAGLLGVVDSGNTKKQLETIYNLHVDPETDNLIANQIEIIEEQLKLSKDLEISKRTELVADLAALKIKNEQYTKLRNDNDIIEFKRQFLFKLGRKLKPSATEDEIIRIIREVRNGK